MLCRVGQELGMSLESVAEMSLPELELWMAYFTLQTEASKNAAVRQKGLR